MKAGLLVTAAAFLISGPAMATTYRGSFDTLWKLGAFEDFPAVAAVEATSDGASFQIDSMKVQFTAEIPARSAQGSGALDPIAVSINMFTDSQPLSFVPGSNIATIEPLEFGWDVQYSGVYREGLDFDAVGVDSQTEVGTRSTDTLLDFGAAGQIEVIFDTNVAWALPFLSTPIGISFTGLSKPTEPVLLTPGIPGDTDGDGDVDGTDFLDWQRSDGTADGLAIWLQSFGPAAAPAGASQAPEPAALALALLGSVAYFAARRAPSGSPLTRRPCGLL